MLVGSATAEGSSLRSPGTAELAVISVAWHVLVALGAHWAFLAVQVRTVLVLGLRLLPRPPVGILERPGGYGRTYQEATEQREERIAGERARGAAGTSGRDRGAASIGRGGRTLHRVRV